MNADDARQQQELEEERRQKGMEILDRLTRWQHNEEDILYLASELGLSTEFRRTQQREVA